MRQAHGPPKNKGEQRGPRYGACCVCRVCLCAPSFVILGVVAPPASAILIALVALIRGRPLGPLLVVLLQLLLEDAHLVVVALSLSFLDVLLDPLDRGVEVLVVRESGALRPDLGAIGNRRPRPLVGLLGGRRHLRGDCKPLKVAGLDRPAPPPSPVAPPRSKLSVDPGVELLEQASAGMSEAADVSSPFPMRASKKNSWTGCPTQKSLYWDECTVTECSRPPSAMSRSSVPQSPMPDW